MKILVLVTIRNDYVIRDLDYVGNCYKCKDETNNDKNKIETIVYDIVINDEVTFTNISFFNNVSV